MKNIVANASANFGLQLIRAALICFCFVDFHWYQLTGSALLDDSYKNEEFNTWDEIYDSIKNLK